MPTTELNLHTVKDSHHTSSQLADDAVPAGIEATHRGALYGDACHALSATAEDSTATLHRCSESAGGDPLSNREKVLQCEDPVYILLSFWVSQRCIAFLYRLYVLFQACANMFHVYRIVVVWAS